jgi:hypothetical protein
LNQFRERNLNNDAPRTLRQAKERLREQRGSIKEKGSRFEITWASAFQYSAEDEKRKSRKEILELNAEHFLCIMIPVKLTFVSKYLTDGIPNNSQIRDEFIMRLGRWWRRIINNANQELLKSQMANVKRNLFGLLRK